MFKTFSSKTISSSLLKYADIKAASTDTGTSFEMALQSRWDLITRDVAIPGCWTFNVSGPVELECSGLWLNGPVVAGNRFHLIAFDVYGSPTV